MLSERSSRRRPVRAAATTAVAIGAMLVIISSASAAIPVRLSAATLAGRTGRTAVAPAGRDAPAQAGHHSAGRSLRTLFSTVRVFDAASNRHWVRGKITRRGTGVSITCWTTGSFYKDVPIWYEVSAPVAGYVSAFNLVAHYSPAIGVPHCVAPVFHERFNALEPDLHIRTAPSTTATITGILPHVGSKATVECWVTGTPVFQDAIWYHTDGPASGYVSGRLLNTGGDPAPGVPHC